MKDLLGRRPSGAMVVSVIALILAASGTAVAASGVANGDNVIKKHSLSGNRLRNHTITGKQVNMGKLGKVRSAQHADSATTATFAGAAGTASHANTANSATNATNATHAQDATSAASSATTDNIKTWYATATPGQTVTLLTVGPFTYTGVCGGTASSPTAETDVATSQFNSALQSYEGTSMTPFGPNDGPQLIGDNISGTPPIWDGPDDGSDAVLSGDGHTYVNTFTALGTGVAGNAGCTFAGHAAVVIH
jgi:hypothetical protein